MRGRSTYGRLRLLGPSTVVIWILLGFFPTTAAAQDSLATVEERLHKLEQRQAA